MKLIFSIAFTLLTLNSYAQSSSEAPVLQLSANVFAWEVENKIDSLDDVFDRKFTGYTSGGDHQNKEQYMATLKGGKVVHNSITVEESMPV